MDFINGYLVSKYEFRTVKDDYTTAVIPDIYHQYNDIETGSVYLWDSKEFRDASFYQGYQYSKYDSVERIQPDHIYLAQPGHRIIGRINGIDEDSCSLICNLNNADELSFTVNRIIDGKEVPFYEEIARLYELYIPTNGWFKITEEPQIDNDGTVETKSVTAESLEIELQQYDLVDFIINTGDPSSKEMLATDNTYEEFEYTMARDNVLFYRNTTELEKDIELFRETDGSVEALKEFASQHTELIYIKDAKYGYSYGCWRITRDENNEIQIDATHAATKDEQESGISYPDYTGTEILDMELKRQHELSLLWLILHEHGWNIGFVDPTVDLESENEMDRNPLANRVDSFEIDSQDIYSFLTQEVSSVYRCIFVFDTNNYLVHAYNLNNVGFDTNIFLSFRNIQNQITRSSDRDLYTVFHVRGDEDLDFTEVNFGEDTVVDISYFLNTNHFSQEFIDKYNAWLEYRESRRDAYKTSSVDYRLKLAKANEIYSRVPLDNIEGKQYSTMTYDELNEEKARIEATKRGLEALYVDSEGNFDYDALAESDDKATYDAIVNFTLSSPLDAIDYATLEEYVDPADDKTKYRQGFDYDKYEEDHGESIDSMRLGNIDIAIFNRRIIDGWYTDPDMSDEEKRRRTKSKNQIDYLDNYYYDFETYGYMFGVAELEAQLATLEQNISALTSTGYDESDGTIYDEETYAQYRKYKDAYDSCKVALEERKQEYQDAKDEIQTAIDTQTQIKEDVAITNPIFEFTDEELALLDKYFIHTDYTNNNILITDIFTEQEIVDAEYQLYLDAIDQLYVESHPQYLWSTSQDNLLLMPEFQNWHGQLHVGNFIWVSLRDDYQVKLRISSISLNPLMIEPEIQIDFTSMVSYKSRRNDYADLLASSNASMKNSISTSINSRSNSDNQINIDTALVMKLLNSQAFSGYMNSSNYNSNSNVATIARDAIQAANINVGQIVGQQAQFDEMFTHYLKSNIIIANMLNVNNANINDLTAEIIRVGEDGITEITEDAIRTANISADQITSGTIKTDYLDVTGIINAGATQIRDGIVKTTELSADQIKSGTIDTDRINVSDVITVGTDAITTIAEGTITTENVVASLVNAQKGDFDNLTANTAFIQYLNSGVIEVGTVSAERVIAALVEAKEGDFDNLTSDSAFIQYLNSGVIEAGTVSADTIIAGLADVTPEQIDKFNVLAGSAFIDYLESNMIVASEIKVDDLKAKLAQIDTLTAGSAFVNYLQSLSSTTAQATITEGYIMNLVSGRITVADLATHTASADQIVLISQDNSPSIAFKDSTQQFYDSYGNVRVQIGQDGNGDFNFIVRGEDGTTALFNENGITRNGIPNSTIINNMISDSTIEKAKLNFPIVETNPDGTINITQIKDGSGGNFGVEYTTFKQGTTDALDEINSKKMYRVTIESNNGNIFKNGDVNCTLSCKVYSWDDDITDDINAANFTWTRKSRDTAGDTQWNANHSGGTKTLTITPADVYGRSVFYCTVTLPDGSTVTGT